MWQEPRAAAQRSRRANLSTSIGPTRVDDDAEGALGSSGHLQYSSRSIDRYGKETIEAMTLIENVTVDVIE
jgi:hypothetical protein